MSNLSDMRNYSASYNGYEVLIETISETHIVIDDEPFKISVVDAYIKSKGQSKVYLGSFFVHLPKVLEENDEKNLISFLICNIDTIICDRYRYIGNFENDSVKEATVIDTLKTTFPKPLEEELKNIYLEFLSIDKEREPKKYRNYASFLEFYFYGQEHIPDSIKIEYMKKNKGKTLLDYNEIDSDIRLQFSGNTYESHKKEKDEIKRKIQTINIENIKINQEICSLEDFIAACEFLCGISDNADRIDCDAKRLETKISRIKLAFLKKMKLKNNLKQKNNDLRTLTKTERDGSSSLKADILARFPNLEEKIREMSLGNLLNLLNNMKKERVILIGENSKKIGQLGNELEGYEEDELDFSYFFQRISMVNNTLEKRRGYN